MRDKFEQTIVLDAIGTLDYNEDNKLILTVQDKDDVKVFDFEEILNKVVGTQIQIKSISDVK
jgi:hypothetical protein